MADLLGAETRCEIRKQLSATFSPGKRAVRPARSNPARLAGDGRLSTVSADGLRVRQSAHFRTVARVNAPLVLTRPCSSSVSSSPESHCPECALKTHKKKYSNYSAAEKVNSEMIRYHASLIVIIFDFEFFFHEKLKRCHPGVERF